MAGKPTRRPKPQGVKKLSAKIPTDLLRRAKGYAGFEGMTLRQLLIEAIEARIDGVYCAKREKPPADQPSLFRVG
jgi:hypothetical protein